MYDRVHGASLRPGLILKYLSFYYARNLTSIASCARVLRWESWLCWRPETSRTSRLFTSSPRVMLFRKPVRRSLRSRHSAWVRHLSPPGSRLYPATGRVNGFVNGADHFANCNTARVFTQQITAARATNAGNQSILRSLENSCSR